MTLIACSIFMNNSMFCIAGEYHQPVSDTNQDKRSGENIGWKFINNSWYFYDENGFIQTGWICSDSNVWYYLSDSGEMLVNTVTPDGYTVDENGAWVPDAKTYLGINFSKDDIAYIDFYNIPIPIAAKMKHIVLKDDIALIYNAINNCIIDKDKKYNALTGGAYYLEFVKQDGTTTVLNIGSTYVSYMSQYFMLKDFLMTEELWETLEYEEIAISQEALVAWQLQYYGNTTEDAGVINDH